MTIQDMDITEFDERTAEVLIENAVKLMNKKEADPLQIIHG